MTTKENFFLSTIANFYKVEETPERDADFESFTGRKKFLPNYKDWDDVFDFEVSDKEGEIIGYLLQEDEEIFSEFEILEKKEDGILLREKEKLSSAYWYDNKGVYRMSNHWGNIRDNEWLLNGHEIDGSENEDFLIGYCPWENFSEIPVYLFE